MICLVIFLLFFTIVNMVVFLLFECYNGLYAALFGDCMKEIANAEIAVKMLNTLDSLWSGEYVEPVKIKRVFAVHTNEERLAYYRAHGMTDCDDYPGGDSQFELDVLSGVYHASEAIDGPMLCEDEYVCQAAHSGKLKFDVKFLEYVRHPRLFLAYCENAGKNGVWIDFIYPGGPAMLKYDIEHNQFVKKSRRFCDCNL